MLFLTLVLMCVALTIILVRSTTGDYWKKRNIAEVKGIIWYFIFGRSSLAEVYKQIYDKFPSEPHVGFYLGTKPALLLRDLENIQAVLSGDFQNFHSRGIVTNPNDILADNVLFIDDYPRWKVLRQKLSPVFTSLKLKNMFYILEKCARDFVEMVNNNSLMVDKPFDFLYTYTTASIGASVFGIDTHTRNTMESPFLDMVKKTLEPSLKASLSFFLANTFPSLFKLLNLKAFEEHEEFFVGVVKNVLASRRKDSVKRHDFIDICLELQNSGTMKDYTTGYELEPTDELLAAQAFFFFIAGADTSANTMHFTLLELSSNSEVLKRVHEEIDNVFNDCDNKINFNDIEKLQYLDMVLNEAMRKYPPIGLMQRRCGKETTLPVGNVTIEKDTLAIVPLYAVHRDAKYYPNPELFDPERFSPQNLAKLPKFCYMPFGEGNRFCLGKFSLNSNDLEKCKPSLCY